MRYTEINDAFEGHVWDRDENEFNLYVPYRGIWDNSDGVWDELEIVAVEANGMEISRTDYSLENLKYLIYQICDFTNIDAQIENYFNTL